MEVVTVVGASSKKRGRDEEDNEEDDGGKKKKWTIQDWTLTKPDPNPDPDFGERKEVLGSKRIGFGLGLIVCWSDVG